MRKNLLYDAIALLPGTEKESLFGAGWTQVFSNAKNSCFIIDNVKDYVLDCGVNEWGPHNVPNVAPPFESFWMEYHGRATPKGNTDLVGKRVGVLFDSQKLDTGWTIAINPCIEFPGVGIISASLICFIEVGTNGEWNGIDVAVKKGPLVNDLTREEIEEGRDSTAGMLLSPCLLALAFLHCKNCEIVKCVPGVLPLTKKRMQHLPRTVYHTLNIKPMQKILENEGGVSKTGLKLALHICRGHFKDFSKGNGLFGRAKGVFWWNSQIKGNAKYGKTNKNYNISPESALFTEPECAYHGEDRA